MWRMELGKLGGDELLNGMYKREVRLRQRRAMGRVKARGMASLSVAEAVQ